MLTQLVYASSAVRPLDEGALADILRVSRQNNAAAGLTGALLYNGGNVMQVLEGETERVNETFERIEADARHRGVIVLLRSEVEERAFPEWAMGCRFASPGAGSSEMRSLFDLTAGGPTRAHRLLSTFRRAVGAFA